MALGWAEALRLHAQELQDLQGDHADEFLKLLQGLKDTLAGRFTATAPPESTLDSFRVLALVRETEAAIAVLETKAQGQYTVAQKESVSLAVDHAGTELDLMAKAFGKGAEPLDVSLSAVKALADPAQGLLASHFQTSVDRYGGDLLNQVRQRVFVGMRTGDTVGKVASSITGKQGIAGAVNRSNAERLVRTEVSNAYGAAQHNSIKQAAQQVEGLKKMWVHVGSFLCPTCGPLHGTERPLDGTWTIKSGRKTREVAHAPGHPNCTCRVTTIKPSWRSAMKKLGYLGEQGDDGEPGKAAL